MRRFPRYDAGCSSLLLTRSKEGVAQLMTCGASMDASLGVRTNRLSIARELSEVEDVKFDNVYATNDPALQIVCVEANDDIIVIGLDTPMVEGEVRVLSRDGALRSTLLKSATGVRDVSLSPDGTWVACVRSFDRITVVKTDDVSDFKDLKPEHAGGAKAAVFDPAGAYLASVGADGALRFWSVSEGFSLVGEATNCVPKEDANFLGGKPNGVNRPSWSPSGGWLAVGAGGGRVLVFRREAWKQAHLELRVEASAALTMTCVEFIDEDYLVCHGFEFDTFSKPAIFVFHVPTGKLLKTIEVESPVWRLAVEKLPSTPTQEQQRVRVAACDDSGVVSLYTLSDLYASGAASGVRPTVEEEDEALDPSLTSVTRIKRELGFDEDGSRLLPSGDKREDDEALGDSDAEDTAGRSRLAVAELGRRVARLERRPPFFSTPVFHVNNTSDPTSGKRPERTLLAWNSAGRVVKRWNDKYVDVEYTDLAHYSGNLSVADPFESDAAALSPAGLVLCRTGRRAAEEEDEVSRPPANIKFHPCDQAVKPWGPYSLPPGETIQLVASGTAVTVVLTSQNVLRVYRTLAGSQDDTVAVLLQGNVVSMVVEGSTLLIVSQRDDRVFHKLMDFGANTSPSTEPETISESGFQLQHPTSKVTWIGLSKTLEGSTQTLASVLTSEGVLMGWNGSNWRPLLTLPVRERFFPIHVETHTGSLVAVKLDKKRGSFESVEAAHPPSPDAFPFRLWRLSYATSDKNKAAAQKLEEREHEISKSRLLSRFQPPGDNVMLAQADRALLQQFLFAVSVKNEEKAVRWFALLNLPRAKEIALKKADDMGASPQLMELLRDLASGASEEKEEEEEDREEEPPARRVVMLGEEEDEEDLGPQRAAGHAKRVRLSPSEQQSQSPPREDPSQTPPSRQSVHAAAASRPIPFLVSSSPSRDPRPTGLAAAFGSPVKTPQLSRAAALKAKSVTPDSTAKRARASAR